MWPIIHEIVVAPWFDTATPTLN